MAATRANSGLPIPSLRDQMLTISNHTGHPSLTLRTGTVEVSETRSDWVPGSEYSAYKLTEARMVPHGVTLIGRLFEEGTFARAGLRSKSTSRSPRNIPPAAGYKAIFANAGSPSIPHNRQRLWFYCRLMICRLAPIS